MKIHTQKGEHSCRLNQCCQHQTLALYTAMFVDQAQHFHRSLFFINFSVFKNEPQQVSSLNVLIDTISKYCVCLFQCYLILLFQLLFHSRHFYFSFANMFQYVNLFRSCQLCSRIRQLYSQTEVGKDAQFEHE